MSESARTLLASINGQAVGTLFEDRGLWSFAYSPTWVQGRDAFDLAPSLQRAAEVITDGASERPVQWFFDNLLPEETARELLAQDAQIPSADAFGLLAHFGRESAGAITLLAPGEVTAESGYLPLTDEELHERIGRLPHHALASGAPKRMSLAGAQHKIAVSIRDGRLFHPVGDAASTHILKPDHSDSDAYPQSVANEYFVMRLAHAMGMKVPAVDLRYVPEPIYQVERFDRKVIGQDSTRIHVIDACQLMGLDRSFKYQQSRPKTLIHCIDACQNRAVARQRLLAWSLFNILTGNGDAHLKNLSFLVKPTGIELAPFYDLVSTECYRAEIGNQPRWPATSLSMSIGGATTFGAVTRKDFMDFAVGLGANRRAVNRMLDEFCSGIEPAAEQLYEEMEKRAVPSGAQRAGELRVLRSIRFAVIRDMASRLRNA